MDRPAYFRLPARLASARHRRGGTMIWMPVGIVVVLGVVAGTGMLIFGMPAFDEMTSDGPQVRTSKRGQFVHRVTETGDIESSANVEIRCEVKARGTMGTQIIDVAPEGAIVEEGEVLVQLDATAFETELTSQQMAVSQAEASMIQAENEYRTAVIALDEYTEGTFKQEELLIQSEISVAEENLRRAQQYLEYSQKLATKGYVTPLQLEADQFAVEKAEAERGIAVNKLEVLRVHTRKKMVTELENTIRTTEAKWVAERRSHELEMRKLDDIKTQIAKCTVRAPAPGQVVHANQRSRRGGNDVVIEPGVLIRENQVMIRLPDPRQMQVKAKINEARVDLVKPGMAATIQVGAFPDMKLTGKVERVNRYAEPGSFFSTNVKTYATYIRIDGSNEKLRPGLTAEVQIEVARLDDALMLPITCVLEHGGKHYCMVRRGNGWEPQPRELKIGPSNETTVVIEQGLEEGEVVAANPQRHREEVRWPKIDPKQQEEADSSAPTQPTVPPTGGGLMAMFQAADTNGDGKLTAEEVGAERWGFVSRADKNGDGAVDRAELRTVQRAMKAAGGPPVGAAGALP
ncbi:MAG: HlyD family efflux transporter periplasmic adaptor subunit [Planctomycetota bacterium]|nr:MAG: HlyD family efflux transporter periplasmic adaptor subunit [Planctomycetota bacterium]